MEINMPTDVKYVLDELIRNGYEAYIVGGCVRDSIMGIVPHDWDICTSALPNEVVHIFNEYKIIPTGIKHGTVTIVFPSGQYEITTYRVDGEYKDNRHPDKVHFTNSLLEDLKRRDFTINALAYNQYSGLIDYFGGMDDIKKKIIRCVGSPGNRFNEDALRMMRAIRFAATLKFKIEIKTVFYLLKYKHLLKNVSIERINAELSKYLRSSGINRINLILMLECLKVVLPDFSLPTNRDICSLIKSNIQIFDVVEKNMKLIVRLAALFGKNKLILSDTLRSLRFDNSTIRKTSIVNYYGQYLLDIGNPKHNQNLSYRIRKIISKIGYNNTYLVLRYVAVYNYKLYFRLYNIFLEVEQECNLISEMNINGNDLIQLGYSGKQIGECLEYLLECILINQIENNHEVLLSKAKKLNIY